MLAFFRVFTLGMGALRDCAFGPMACVVLQSEGLECRHNSLICVLVFMALWPAQHLPALDFHERASVCLSAGFAVLHLGHIGQACLCVCEYVSALECPASMLAFFRALTLGMHAMCECVIGTMACVLLQSEWLE